MSLELATWIVRIAACYLAVGLAFALPFVLRWSSRLDPVAEHGTTGFRLLIVPGAVLLWPLLGLRLLRGRP